MFETSEATDKIDAAILAVQGEIKAAAKDARNSHLGNRYADLVSVVEACRESMVKHGISITQWPIHSEDNLLHLVTRLACGGQWMKARMSTPVDKQTPQGFGAAITYGRRYSLAAAIGVVADDDDDGETASRTADRMSAAPAPRRDDFAPNVLDEQLAKIRVLKSVEEADKLAARLRDIKWAKAADKKTAVEAFQKRRAELSAAPREPGAEG